MLTATFSSFWAQAPAEDKATTPPRKRPAPLFIGDAVQPYAGDTLLLALLRADDAEKEDGAP